MSRLVRGAATTVLVIAALASGRAVTDAMPNELGTQMASANPFTVQSRLGEKAALRYADVTAVAARPALGIKGLYGTDTTPGHLLLVDLQIRARDQPVVLGGYTLLAQDGRRYHADRRWPVGLIPTGVTWHVTAVFEVPADAIEGAALEVAKGQDWWAQRRDHVLHVDLGLDAAAAKVFAASRDIVEPNSDPLNPPQIQSIGQVPDE
ncbi:MAG: hypothetical protein ABIZ07_06785 [Dermatophilaceae bacterium]